MVLLPCPSFVLLSLAGSALAFRSMDPRISGRRNDSPELSKRLAFDAKAQRIDVSGQHAFKAPGSGDLRGPCPGLNALSNHNYLPHNGIITTTQAIEATTKVFGMGVDLATVLTTYATLVNGDPLGLKWSIGGPYSGLLGLFGGNGLSGSHNQYESDASPTRADAALRSGDGNTLDIPSFQALYALQAGETGGNYDYPVLKAHARNKILKSRATNPDFYWGAFSGLFVSQAAFTFIPAFFSNASVEFPEGRLDQTVLKSFFGVSGTQGDLKLAGGPGWERIPESWYRRSLALPYSIALFAEQNNDILLTIPERAAVGSNLGTAGSFAGVDLSDLTGGVYNAQNLLQGNNALCFAYETILATTPDLVKGLLANLTQVLSLVTNRLEPIFQPLNCPKLSRYNTGLLPGL